MLRPLRLPRRPAGARSSSSASCCCWWRWASSPREWRRAARTPLAWPSRRRRKRCARWWSCRPRPRGTARRWSCRPASWRADIGTPVKAGQLLAEIETPELDQQLLQAQAELATARANVGLSEATARRWQELLASGMVARQVVEEKTGDLAAKQSVVRALQANVERIETLKRFARITAPFDGVVTARNTDVGALISVGGAAGSELFVVSDTRKVRVYVSVPQLLVGAVKPGSTARLTVPERPGRSHAATVQSLSQAINSASGGMLVQLAVDNPQGELLPGGYASVALEVPRAAGVLTVPPSALIFDKAGVRVAVVGDGDKVQLKPVKIARDLGTSIEISSGLAPQDRVIESPPDGVGAGDTVRVAGGKPGT
jgi:RND family efflux transporter MFP subunit